MKRRDHWESVYSRKAADEMSWFQARAEASLALVRQAAPGRDSGIIDVGGGDSRLVDGLLDDGYRDVTVLDISAAALSRARKRLGDRGERVVWIASDVTAFEPERTWNVWHDRAVLHFLTEASDREAYCAALRRALSPGGHALVATFAPDGPTRCSGLEVVRYAPADLQDLLGEEFVLLSSESLLHTTPSGATQSFTSTHFQRRVGSGS